MRFAAKSALISRFVSMLLVPVAMTAMLAVQGRGQSPSAQTKAGAKQASQKATRNCR